MVSELGDRVKEGCQVGQSGLCMQKECHAQRATCRAYEAVEDSMAMRLLVPDAAVYI